MSRIRKCEDQLTLAVTFDLVNVEKLRTKCCECRSTLDVFRYVKWFQLGVAEALRLGAWVSTAIQRELLVAVVCAALLVARRIPSAGWRTSQRDGRANRHRGSAIGRAGQRESFGCTKERNSNNVAVSVCNRGRFGVFRVGAAFKDEGGESDGSAKGNRCCASRGFDDSCGHTCREVSNQRLRTMVG